MQQWIYLIVFIRLLFRFLVFLPFKSSRQDKKIEELEKKIEQLQSK